jgi:hypothetical protein
MKLSETISIGRTPIGNNGVNTEVITLGESIKFRCPT